MTIKKTSLVSVSLVLTGFFILTNAGSAQQPTRADKPKKGLMEGELTLTARAKTRNPYVEGQDAAINYFTALAGQLDKLAAGDIQPVPAIATDKDDSIPLHMTGVYLFCSINKGTCPFIPDAMIETDVINSRINKKAKCDTMPLFWKIWAKNEMQKKHDFQVKTGYMRDTINFRKDKLPSYIGCTATVTQLTSDGAAPMSDAEFFKKRYGADSQQRKAITGTLTYLNALKKSNIQVFHATSPR